jgi:hypothetical protein
MPAISTFRVDKSMKNKMINRCRPCRVPTSPVIDRPIFATRGAEPQ